MKQGAHDYLGLGIYSIPEAAMLTGVSSSRIRRWVQGYTHSSGASARRSERVWHGELPAIEHHSALSFLDLMEVRFVDAYLDAGVSWPTLRDAHERASTLVHSTHPFCTNKFKTEGRHVFVDLVELRNEPGLVDVRKNQRYFEQILRPILKDLEFAHGEIRRWWPLGSGRQVVLDPTRSFGRPIVNREGIPTSVLNRAAKSNDSLEEVCKWYEVSRESLDDAIAFERRQAA